MLLDEYDYETDISAERRGKRRRRKLGERRCREEEEKKFSHSEKA